MAWIPAALWALLPLQYAAAQQTSDTTPPMSSAQADAQITSLLGQIETLLDEGHVTSPAGGNASEVFSRALALSSLASPAGMRAMAEFASALKSRADAEDAAGHKDLGVRLEVFAKVVSSVMGSLKTLPQADAAPSTQSGVATETAGSAGGAARQTVVAPTHANETMPGLGAADQAASSASGETSRKDVDTSPPKANTDTKSSPLASPASINPIDQHVPPSARETRPLASSGTSQNVNTAKGSGIALALPAPAKPIAQHVPPPAGETGPPASGAPRNVETAKVSGSTQVAALPPAAAAPATSPDGITATAEPAKVPPPSPAMVDMLLKQGKAMLSIGDISAARLLFARAAEFGTGEAALALGDTYNPAFLAEHGVVGPQADPELAKAWYRKALAYGEPLARKRLAGLGDDTHAEAQGSTNAQ